MRPLLLVPFEAKDCTQRGVGLGLAALLMQLWAQEGRRVGLARSLLRAELSSGEGAAPQRERLSSQRPACAVEAAPRFDLEALLAPADWRALHAPRGDGERPPEGLVVSGSVQAPGDVGELLVRVFGTGAERVEFECTESFEAHEAGAALARALAAVERHLGLTGSPAHLLAELEWEPLESLLLAESCSLHTNGVDDEGQLVACAMHLVRGLQEAPKALPLAWRLHELTLGVLGRGERPATPSVRRLVAAIEGDRHPLVCLTQAHVASAERDFSRVLSLCTALRAAGDDPLGHAGALEHAARRALGQADEAAALLEQLLERHPESLPVQREHAQALRDAGELLRASVLQAPWLAQGRLTADEVRQLVTDAQVDPVAASVVADALLAAAQFGPRDALSTLHLLGQEPAGLARQQRAQHVLERLDDEALQSALPGWGAPLQQALCALDLAEHGFAWADALAQRAPEGDLASEALEARWTADAPARLERLERAASALASRDAAVARVGIEQLDQALDTAPASAREFAVRAALSAHFDDEDDARRVAERGLRSWPRSDVLKKLIHQLDERQRARRAREVPAPEVVAHAVAAARPWWRRWFA